MAATPAAFAAISESALLEKVVRIAAFPGDPGGKGKARAAVRLTPVKAAPAVPRASAATMSNTSGALTDGPARAGSWRLKISDFVDVGARALPGQEAVF